jgi:hypothetical protein
MLNPLQKARADSGCSRRLRSGLEAPHIRVKEPAWRADRPAMRPLASARALRATCVMGVGVLSALIATGHVAAREP